MPSYQKLLYVHKYIRARLYISRARYPIYVPAFVWLHAKSKGERENETFATHQNFDELKMPRLPTSYVRKSNFQGWESRGDGGDVSVHKIHSAPMHYASRKLNGRWGFKVHKMEPNPAIPYAIARIEPLVSAVCENTCHEMWYAFCILFVHLIDEHRNESSFEMDMGFVKRILTI